MSTTFRFEGLEALTTALRQLPDALIGEATTIVAGAADATAADIITAYPSVTGNLRRGVTVQTVDGGKGGVLRIVRSNAKHVHLYEYGHMTRPNTRTGTPGHHIAGKNVFIPIAERRRRRMYEDLITMLGRAGLDVRR